MRISSRAQAIEPFYVMEVAKAAIRQAQAAAHSDKPMVFLNIGEPDFTAPPDVQQAAQATIAAGSTQYTQATGLPALRERISQWYAQRFGLHVEADRIVITAGASAALQLACLALVDPGDEILMPDPSYPCNRHFVTAAGGITRMLPASAAQRFQLSAEQVAQAWTPATRGIMLASPSNPTGTSIAPDELRRIHATVQSHSGICLVDEIYLPLSYDEQFGQTALHIADDIISINSFSKYFNMTGWRLGWMVVPPALVPVMERLAQHLFICPSTVSQQAALACFEPESLALYEQRRAEFKQRRDYFVPALAELGLHVPVMPDGAFYAWANCTELCQRLGISNSWDLAFALLEQAHVAITPGRDFGQHQTEQFVRFSTANSLQQLETAVDRIRTLIRT
ncbi:pyridoxal phosphate-dependent aminotransferase [Curvibacter sp. CHRR-16]|uniref:pyridoxal phosphate-dependent aminotransferase n=1 Tax=Curvibacter sp. CHRR-16 TaxID=2835872 RepID=UPI001BDB3380|nr:pyridoxal phosphate-dependent aminotransferase [Curvibacter sp. CHRR-16]MBT0568966.1 pyridoxal phosphate-dependent aminotransferase [Curvibacter sp. CHRR-16]